MKFHQLAVSAFLLAILAWAGCKDKGNPNYLDEADCTGIVTDDNTYTNSIKTIIDNNCAFAGCHGGGSVQNGVELTTYANVRKAFEEQPGLCAIHHGEDCEHMPKDGAKLSDALIQKIDCWAKNGYKQ